MKAVIECTEPMAEPDTAEEDSASSLPAAKNSSAYDRDRAVEEHCASRPGPGDAPAFDRRAAHESIARAADEAHLCPRANGESKGWVVFSLCGDGTVAEVAFDSSKGELTDRSLRSAWARCVVGAFSKVKVPPYKGELLTVGKSFP
jgi:hypothetical protein